MNPPCHQCASGLFCTLHSSPPASPSSSSPPLNANFMEGASGQSALAKSKSVVHYVASETPSAPSQPPSERDLLIVHMNDVDNEIERWEIFEWQGDKTMGTINLVEFWKIHRYMFPLLYQVAMNILPVQASFISSERAFSSSKMTCTRERNRISAEHMEYLQVLKHSLHRRRATPDNNQTLDFMAHIASEESDDECEE